MDNANSVMVPKLIPLEGRKNLRTWNGMLRQILRCYGLVDYILKDETQIRKTARSQAALVAMIMESAMPVMDQLVVAGWDLEKVEQDPKDVYDLIMSTFSEKPPAFPVSGDPQQATSTVQAHGSAMRTPSEVWSPEVITSDKLSAAEKKGQTENSEGMNKLQRLAQGRLTYQGSRQQSDWRREIGIGWRSGDSS